MFLATLALCASSNEFQEPAKREVAPRTATWKQMTAEVFDPDWMLPGDLPVATEEGSGPAWKLVPKMKELCALVVDPSPTDASAPRCLGDIVVLARKGNGDSRSVSALCERVRTTQPKLWTELAPCLSELLCDSELRSKKWDPDDDSACDGMFFARPLTREGCTVAPWGKFKGSKLVQQAATLMYADIAAIKAAENDYTTYPDRPGSNYLAIYPIDGSYLRGDDEKGNPFAALKLYFKCDLPFPFTTYECDLRILNWTDRNGDFACEIFSPSRDFYWMAGRDVFYPVKTITGECVATLVVRLFGFDLDGVPDDDDARRAGLRSSLGSLAREIVEKFPRHSQSGAVGKSSTGFRLISTKGNR